MTRRTASILAWGSCAVSVLFVVLSIVVTARNAPTGPTPFGPDIALSVPATAGLGLVLLSFSVIGALIAVRRPDNGVGWLFCANGLADSFFNLAGSLEAHGLVTNPGTIPGAAWFGLASDALWLPFIAMTTMFLFLLFPEGTAGRDGTPRRGAGGRHRGGGRDDRRSARAAPLRTRGRQPDHVPALRSRRAGR